jgi:hypothetical protein
MSMSGYYIFVDQQYGPFDIAALKSLNQEGRFTKDSWVFLEGETADWTQAQKVKSLQSIFTAPPAAPKPAAAPKPSDSLAQRLKQAQAAQPPTEEDAGQTGFGTMLVSPKESGVRSIESKLPSAPLSDIPTDPLPASKSASAAPSESSASKSDGWFKKLLRTLRLAK